jgi:hypothetical protein
MNASVNQWLSCRLDQGMFSDEIAVTHPPVGQALLSVFVPASAVSGKPKGLGKVRVQVTRQGNSTLAILPTDYSESVTVTEADLSDAP